MLDRQGKIDKTPHLAGKINNYNKRSVKSVIVRKDKDNEETF